MQKRIVIYASPIPATYIVGPALAKFISRNPNIRVSLKTNDCHGFFSDVEERSFDLGIFDIADCRDNKTLDCEHLLSSVATLCTRKDHPLQSRANLLALDVADFSLALPASLPDYVSFELNRILGLPLENNQCVVGVNYDSLVTVRHAIIASDLIALAPSIALTQSLSAELHPLAVSDWPMMEAEFGIVTKRQQNPIPEIELLIECLIAQAEQMSQSTGCWYL